MHRVSDATPGETIASGQTEYECPDPARDRLRAAGAAYLAAWRAHEDDPTADTFLAPRRADARAARAERVFWARPI